MIALPRRACLAVLALFLAAAAPAGAGTTTIKYIAGNPAFTLEVPDGWAAEEERYNLVHPLEIRPKKGGVPYRVQMFYFPIGDTDNRRGFVRELAGQQAHDDALASPVYDLPVEDVSKQKIDLTMQALHGKRQGVEHSYVFIYFVMKNHGYVLAVNGPAATFEQAAKVTDAIIQSIRPLKGK